MSIEVDKDKDAISCATAPTAVQDPGPLTEEDHALICSLIPQQPFEIDCGSL